MAEWMPAEEAAKHTRSTARCIGYVLANGLTPSAIRRVVKKYGQRAGLEISPHTLRHTFGTRMDNARSHQRHRDPQGFCPESHRKRHPREGCLGEVDKR